jgi:hypothetical protein
MDLDLINVRSAVAQETTGVTSTYQALRKRYATDCMSGRLSRFLFQHSSTTFHAADESPNLEASVGLEGRLPLITIW